MVAPADSTKFHPVFINELNQGRESSTCKKSPDIRRKEILEYAISTLLDLVTSDAEFWLSNASLATEMSAIVKAGKNSKIVIIIVDFCKQYKNIFYIRFLLITLYKNYKFLALVQKI